MKRISRKICLKWIKPISLILIGIMIGIGGLTLWFCCSNTTIKDTNEYDPWLISYYCFQIIGAIGTVMAVVVALSKEAIMKWLYAPALKTSLIDEGVTENIPNESQRVPEAQSFECYINVENIGSLAALGCKVFISDVRFGVSKTNIKMIKNSNNRQLRWASSSVDIPIGISSKIKLFEIVNPNTIGTPISQPIQNPKITFNGCELKRNQSQKGTWEIKYFISCQNGEATTFIITIDWTGEYKSRAIDMAEVLKVQIKER